LEYFNPTQSQAHLQVAQANTPPKPAKELAFPTHGETEKYAAKMNNRITNDKNGQLVTSGIFYCRDNAKMQGCGSLQTSLWLDSDVLRNRQQKHTAVRCVQW